MKSRFFKLMFIKKIIFQVKTVITEEEKYGNFRFYRLKDPMTSHFYLRFQDLITHFDNFISILRGQLFIFP